MAKKVGFIGLGMMGTPISKNLLKASFELTVWNRTRSEMDEIVASGAKASNSAKAVAQQSEATITMLTGSPDSEEVILGNNGVLEGIETRSGGDNDESQSGCNPDEHFSGGR